MIRASSLVTLFATGGYLMDLGFILQLLPSFLLLCDGGGSNSSRSYLFKEALQALTNELGIEIRIAHYLQVQSH